MIGRDEDELNNLMRKDEVEIKINDTRRRFRAEFIMVPLVWEKQLSKSKCASTFKVAWRLLDLDRKERHKQQAGWKKSEPVVVKLTNTSMTEKGVTRWQKYRALRELETLGLIKTEKRPDKSPLVRLLRMGSVARDL